MKCTLWCAFGTDAVVPASECFVRGSKRVDRWVGWVGLQWVLVSLCCMKPVGRFSGRVQVAGGRYISGGRAHLGQAKNRHAIKFFDCTSGL